MQKLRFTMKLGAVCLLLSGVVHAQPCLPPTGWTGCANTDYTNAFMSSTSNAGTLEYDNWVSGFHATAIRNGDGTFNIWGENIGVTGTGSDILTPQNINTAYPALTGTVLKVAVGGYTQVIILSTDGLFMVGGGRSDLVGSKVLSSTVIPVPGGPFVKLTSTQIPGSNTYGLPTGVVPGDIKMMFASSYMLVLTTCSGEVYILAHSSGTPTGPGNLPVIGDGSGNKNTNQWYKVKTSVTTYLSKIVAARGNGSSVMALDSDDNLWVWGLNVYLGNGSVQVANQNFAVPMTKPAMNSGAKIKMIGTTSTHGAFGTKPTYFVLATDGNLYALGGNNHRQLGNWDGALSESTTWVQPRYSLGGPVMDNIKWISPQEHYTDHSSTYGEGSASISVLTNDGILYNWGLNRRGLLGRPDGGSNALNIYDPAVPVNSGTAPNNYPISTTDTWNGVEMGGHTSLGIRTCENQLIYGGHYIHGSMGNGATPPPGQSDDHNQFFFTKVNTPIVGICSAEPVTLSASTDVACNGTSFTVTGYPIGGLLSVPSANAVISGNQITPNTGNDPVTVAYTACGITKELTLYKKDMGNLTAAIWPIASATVISTNKAWLGGITSTTGLPSTECTTLTTDEVDGFTITSPTSGSGTAASPWVLDKNQTYPATLVVNGNGAAKPVYWAIWYDVNGNGNFTDAEDGFYSGNTTHGSPASAAVSLVVPAGLTATNGAIRIAATSLNTVFTKSMNGMVQVHNGEVEDFYIAYTTPLPLTLNYFKANKIGTNAVLTWETSEEKNTATFEIENSQDAIAFTKIGSLAASSNSAKNRNYSFTHKAPGAGKQYYRLKMVDKDGKVAYSLTRMLAFAADESKVNISPNPTKEVLVFSELVGNETIKLIDATGRLVKTAVATGTTFSLSVDGLPAGLYFAKIIGKDGKQQTKKVIKVD